MRDREIIDGMEKIIREKRHLEALILQFRQDIKKEYEGVPYMYILEYLEKYDRYFNIIEARNGQTNP